MRNQAEAFRVLGGRSPIMAEDEVAHLRRRLAEAEAELASLKQRDPEARDARDAARIIEEITGTDNGTDPFAAAVKATRMPMVISNPRLSDNPIVFVNDAFCRLAGYPREEIVGRNCRFLQGPDTDRNAVALIRAAIEAVQTIKIDILNYRKTGETFWNRLLMAPVRDAQGDLAYFFASQVDVTLEREKLEGLESHNAALMAEVSDRLHTEEENAARLHFATEAGHLGIWEHDLRTDVLMASGITKENYGRDRSLPFTWAEMEAAVHPDDREVRATAYAHSIEQGIDYDVEFRVLCSDGSIRWVSKRAQVLRNSEGAVVRMAGVCQDVTARREAENRRLVMLELADRIRDIENPADLAFAAAEILGRRLGVSRAGFGVVDPAAETITIERDWNAPGVQSLAGVLRFRDYGSYIEDLKRGDLVAFADARTDARTADGAEALEAISARAVLNLPVAEQSGFVALLYLNHAEARTWTDDEVALVRDVADRVQVGIQRRKAEADLRRLAASLERQVEERTAAHQATEEQLRQAQKMEAVGQLTGGVAHDFNNFLTVIRSSVDLLKRPNLAEERRARYVGAISDTVDRAAKLTGQLLAFARRQALRPEVFDVGASVRALSDMMGTLTGSRIIITIDLPDEPIHIKADPSQFDTALVNLAVNARDAMDGAGRITVTARIVDAIPAVRTHSDREGAYVAVALSDTGSGIPADRLERIFEPFFTTKGVGKGTGLGLSQVFGFAKQSGGDVAVDSTVGEGTTFTLYLPHVSTPTMAAVEEPEALVDGHGTRVLVVEDNIDVGTFAMQSLADLGYITVLAVDGLAALAELEKGSSRFDIVFSDVMMPGMNGVELGQEIRRLYRDLPVVLTSGYSHVLAQDGTHGFELLHKPYSVEQLSQVLRKAATWQPRRRIMTK